MSEQGDGIFEERKHALLNVLTWKVRGLNNPLKKKEVKHHIVETRIKLYNTNRIMELLFAWMEF